MADGRFDDLLLGIAQRHKNSEELMYSILSFFERRTDLFHVMEASDERMGFPPGTAEKMFFKQFHYFQQRYLERCQPELVATPAEVAAARAAAAPAEEAAAAAGEAAAAAEGSVGATPGAAVSSASSAAAGVPAAVPEPAPVMEPEPASAATEDSATVQGEGGEAGSLPESTRTMMRHISTWNGAANEKYYWSQSISEVTVEVVLEADAKAKEVDVDITATRLCIKHKGRTVLEGKLHEKVNTEETVWHMDDNKVIFSVEKQRQTWWKCVLEGDDEIDTTKVESTRTMDEYDGETQGAIRKIMFDQTQKVQGKATSDQLRTADVMRDAWNAPGSPFRGSDFDPTLLNLSGPVPDDFFQDIEKRRIEEARKKLEEEGGGAAQGNATGAASSGDSPA